MGIITQIKWFKWMEKYPTEPGLYNVVLRKNNEVWVCYWNDISRRFEQAVPEFTEQGIDVDYWSELPESPNGSNLVNYQTEVAEIIDRRFGKVLMSGSSNDEQINLVDAETRKPIAKITITDRLPL